MDVCQRKIHLIQLEKEIWSFELGSQKCLAVVLAPNITLHAAGCRNWCVLTLLALWDARLGRIFDLDFFYFEEVRKGSSSLHVTVGKHITIFSLIIFSKG